MQVAGQRRFVKRGRFPEITLPNFAETYDIPQQRKLRHAQADFAQFFIIKPAYGTGGLPQGVAQAWSSVPFLLCTVHNLVYTVNRGFQLWPPKWGGTEARHWS